MLHLVTRPDNARAASPHSSPDIDDEDNLDFRDASSHLANMSCSVTHNGYVKAGGPGPKAVSEPAKDLVSLIDPLKRDSIDLSDDDFLRAEIVIVKCVTEIVAAYVSNHSVPIAELPSVIKTVHSLLGGFVQGASGSELVCGNQPATLLSGKPRGQNSVGEHVPAVPIGGSVKPAHIVCLEDGKKFKTLKRHLKSEHGFSPDEYRARWDLPSDYPMVAPQYAARRSSLAKKIGLGSKRNMNRRSKR